MQVKKRTRASHPKVRTGCHTCKARRVKCDEQRPACRKCQSTGRKCEGYQNNREWIVVVAPPLPVTDGFEDDRSRRHFDYFRSQAVYELSWFFNGDDWGRLVLQESHGSPAVRHAVIALACSHEDLKDSSRIAAQAPQYAYAAQHYSKAIRNLIKETSDDAHESRLKALMCGLLFISIEMLRGNNAAALNHLEACLKIVREAQARTGMLSLEGDCLEAIAHMFRDIIPLYARLDTQAGMMFGRAENWDTSNPSKIFAGNLSSPGFETIFGALETLFWLGNKVHEFTGYYHPIFHRQQDPGHSMHTEKFILIGQLMQWDHDAQSLLNANEGTHDYDKLLMMRIHHRTMLTLLESSTTPSESDLDALYWAFEDILSYVSELQDRTPKADEDPSSSSDSEASFTFESNSSLSVRSGSLPVRSRTTTPLPQPPLDALAPRKPARPVFVLDAGIIFSLFWTAVKCRDGRLRRRAIAQLEQSWQEGVWIGMVQAAIAKRVVEIEEEQPYEQYPVLGMKAALDIREDVRVYNVSSEIDKAGRRAKIMLLKRREGWNGVPGEEGWWECAEWVKW